MLELPDVNGCSLRMYAWHHAPWQSDYGFVSCARELVEPSHPPVRLLFGLAPRHHMIKPPDLVPPPKIGMSTLVLLENDVGSSGLQYGNHEVGAVAAIGQKDITVRHIGQQLMKQGVLATALSRIRAERGIQYGIRAQTQQAHVPRYGEPEAWFLTRWLPVPGLIFVRIRHRHGAAIDELHRTAAPSPRG